MKLFNIVAVMYGGGSVCPIERLMSCNFSARKAFSIAKLYRRLSEDFKLYQEQMRNIYERYGKIGDDKNYYFEGENGDKANVQIAELLDTEIDGYGENKLVIDLSEDYELMPKDILALEPFIEFKCETQTIRGLLRSYAYTSLHRDLALASVRSHVVVPTRLQAIQTLDEAASTLGQLNESTLHALSYTDIA